MLYFLLGIYVTIALIAMIIAWAICCISKTEYAIPKSIIIGAFWLISLIVITYQCRKSPKDGEEDKVD